MLSQLAMWSVGIVVFVSGMFLAPAAMQDRAEIETHVLDKGYVMKCRVVNGKDVDEWVYTPDGRLQSRRYTDWVGRVHSIDYDVEDGKELEHRIIE